MAKITAEKIRDMGFSMEMYDIGDSGVFDAQIDDVISEQSAIFEGRIGTTAYDDATNPNAVYVKRAEKNLVCADMTQARIVRMFANAVPNGEALDISALRSAKKAFLTEAEKYIRKIVSGTTTDSEEYAGSAVVSGFSSPISDQLNRTFT